MTEKKVKNSTIVVVKDDLTAMEVDAVVFYASHDLKLGSGYGAAIAQRGGPSIQKELDEMGTLETTQAIVTAGGELNAKYVIHAVGPRFQEKDTEKKLRETTLNALKLADQNGATSIAFPPMGGGFYGVPWDLSAKITLGTIEEYLNGDTGISRVYVVANDNRSLAPLESSLASVH
jgi:O-acetyl-ADP-ribose deacetylase